MKAEKNANQERMEVKIDDHLEKTYIWLKEMKAFLEI
jgi:hypothetical protein